MDSFAPATPVPPQQSAITRRLAFAVATLFIVGVIAAIGTLLSIAARLDREDVEQTRFYTARALENRIATSKSYITSYADWNTAYEHLHPCRYRLGVQPAKYRQNPVHHRRL
jgi:sensor domain CHASE-containing protein